MIGTVPSIILLILPYIIMASGEFGVLNPTTDSLRRTKSSKSIHTRPPLRSSETTPIERTYIKSSILPSQNSIPRLALTPRTSSAPVVPQTKENFKPNINGDSRAYCHRDSVSSIKYDPFFRNYQTPQSVSLAREFRSASYSSNPRDESNPDDVPAPSGRLPTANLALEPVCITAWS